MDISQTQDALLQVMNRFRSIHFFDLLVGGLTKGEFFTLTMIHDHMIAYPNTKGIYVSELAERMQVTSPAVSRMLRGLENRNFIERSVDRDDRRTTYIVLTDQGEAARIKAGAEIQDFSRRVIERMGQEDMEALVTLWTRLTDILNEEQLRVTEQGKGAPASEEQLP